MTSRDGSRHRRLENLYRSHVGDAVRLACLLVDGDPRQNADSAFIKAVAGFRDLRSPLTFEASLRRAVIRECRPTLRRRVPGLVTRPAQEEAADLWRAFGRQSHRRRAALALRYSESLNDDQVADVLGCSTGTARTLVNRGLAALGQASPGGADPARVAGELQRLFRRRTEETKVLTGSNGGAVRRAVLGRALTAGGTLLLVGFLVVGGVLAVRYDLGSDDAPAPPPPSDEEPAQVLSLEDEGLRPDAHVVGESERTTVAVGMAGSQTWELQATAPSGDEICLALKVGTDVERAHCEVPSARVFSAFVDSIEQHDLTFITGYALRSVDRMTLEVDEGETEDVDLLDPPASLPRPLQRNFFLVVLPDTLVPLDSEQEGRDQGLTIIRTLLQGRAADGSSIQHQPIYLGR